MKCPVPLPSAHVPQLLRNPCQGKALFLIAKVNTFYQTQGGQRELWKNPHWPSCDLGTSLNWVSAAPSVNWGQPLTCLIMGGVSPSPCRPLLPGLGSRSPLHSFDFVCNSPASYSHSARGISSSSFPKRREDRFTCSGIIYCGGGGICS